jgi:uroporphyrinogen-III decarboxylase
METQWADLSPDEKRKVRFKRWLLPPGIKFSSPEAKKAYEERVTRLITVIQLKEPDRVPVMLPVGFSSVYYSGITFHEAMYDYDKLCHATIKFLRDFETDTYHGPDLIFPGKVYDKIEFKLFKWPGHGLSPDAPTYQYVEGEYMNADEYDSIIKDPSDFWLRTFLPRIAGAFEPLKRLSQLSPLVGIPIGYLIPYGMPDVQAAFQVLLDASRECIKWMEAVNDCNQKMLALGIPLFWGGIALAPFDGISDMVRGTQGVMLDMFRQPDKLLQAMERITPMTINAAVAAVNASSSPLTFIPLHKGADGFMSEKQFLTFYWPSLKELCLGLINEGIVPLLFAEGGYNTRLHIVKDLPKGAVVWWFDQTDMFRAKKILGDTACICGNIPASLTSTGTPDEVKKYCRKLIEGAGKGGGFILTGGAFTEQAKLENMRAMMTTAKEYGVYTNRRGADSKKRKNR